MCNGGSLGGSGRGGSAPPASSDPPLFLCLRTESQRAEFQDVDVHGAPNDAAFWGLYFVVREQWRASRALRAREARESKTCLVFHANSAPKTLFSNTVEYCRKAPTNRPQKIGILQGYTLAILADLGSIYQRFFSKIIIYLSALFFISAFFLK